MKKKLKDFLHLYLMSEVQLQVKRKNDKDYHIGRMCEITRKSNHGDWVEVWFDDVITVTSQTWETSSSNCHWFFFEEDYIKPILRPLSDMTENEFRISLFDKHLSYFNDTYSFDMQYKNFSKDGNIAMYPNQYLFLLSKQFDLFGLIESELAIDKTKIILNNEK